MNMSIFLYFKPVFSFSHLLGSKLIVKKGNFSLTGFYLLEPFYSRYLLASQTLVENSLVANNDGVEQS